MSDPFYPTSNEERRVVRFFAVLLLAAIVAAAIKYGTASGAPPITTLDVNAAITAEKVALGKALFFDPRLSADGTVSCATCHDPARGYTDHLPASVGIRGQVGRRNSPTIINAVYKELMFWDGRTVRADEQSLQPLVNPIEMGNRSQQQVVNRIARIPGYREMFARAFGRVPNRRDMAHAIEAFESTILSFDAPVDKFLAGDESAMSPAAVRGFELFRSKGCIECHKYPQFRDGDFHNTGITFRYPGNDRGRREVDNSNQRARRTTRAFFTPTLREIAKTYPYMHNGVLPTLIDVVNHYNRGAARETDNLRDGLLDPRIRQLALTEEEKQDLVTFLVEGLSSEHYPYVEPPRLP